MDADALAVVYAVTGERLRVLATADDRSESVVDVQARLEGLTGVPPSMQLLLVATVTPTGLSVSQVPRHRPDTLRAHGLEPPARAARLFLFDKTVMQPNVGVAPPLEKLNAFVGERGARVFALHLASVEACLGRQHNRRDAVEAAVRFLVEYAEGTKEHVGHFEAKWTALQALQPATLLEGLREAMVAAQQTRLRPELARGGQRTLWDLYDATESDFKQRWKSCRKEYATLAHKVPLFLQGCRAALQAAEELVSMPFPSFDLAESCRDDLREMSEQARRPGAAEPDGASLSKCMSDVTRTEQWANNVALVCRMRLQKVTERQRGVWQLREQILGVLGMALETLLARIQPLAVLDRLPALHDAVSAELERRAQFRDAAAATLARMGASLEAHTLRESNRRVAWLSNERPHVREWTLQRFPWLRDELLTIQLPSLSFDRALPLAVQPDTVPLVLDGMAPSQHLPEPATIRNNNNSDSDSATNAVDAALLERRIEHLERELELRNLELAESRRRETAAADSFSSMLMQSDSNLGGLTQMASALATQRRRLRSALMLENFAEGDRVLFERVDGARARYRVWSRTDVWMSAASQLQLDVDEAPLLLTGRLIAPSRVCVAAPHNEFGVREGEGYTELMVELDDTAQ